jgi:hypothetical protein
MSQPEKMVRASIFMPKSFYNRLKKEAEKAIAEDGEPGLPISRYIAEILSGSRKRAKSTV